MLSTSTISLSTCIGSHRQKKRTCNNNNNNNIQLCSATGRVVFIFLEYFVGTRFLSLRYFSLTQEKYKTELDLDPSNPTHFKSNRLKRYNNMSGWRDR